MTSSALRFGIRLPAWCPQGEPWLQNVDAYAASVEEAGFDSIWVLDQLVRPSGYFSSAWLEPLTLLAASAAVTERVQLGTAALALTSRPPLATGAAVASLQCISNGRVILGVCVGWDENVLRAAGVPGRHLGDRFDATLAELERFLGNPDSGLPLPGRRVPIWIAAGRPTESGGIHLGERARHHVARHDGWILPAARYKASELAHVIRAVSALRSELRARTPLEIAIAQFVELSERGRPAELRTLLVEEGEPSDLAGSYWVGPPAAIRAEIESLADAGVRNFILTPASRRREELSILSDELVSPFRRREST